MRNIPPFLILFLTLITLLLSTMEAKDMTIHPLNAKEQHIIPIAAFTAKGDMERLEKALNAGIDVGLSVNEIKEILVQLYAYAGFPRSLNALNTFKTVLERREQKGIHDTLGKEATPLSKEMDKDAYGAQVRAELLGQKSIPEPSGYQLFSPIIDTFLKEHLFADIFARDVLSHQERELVTISALASMQGVNPELAFHLKVAMNTGLSKENMHEFIAVLQKKVGSQESLNAQEVLNTIL